jgi:C4-dicarboxylate-specific signal transduction histidine kinase
MTQAPQIVQRPAVGPASSLAEAARYALLRRLAPSMRHHLVVNLQPIGMIYEVMDRRLRAPQPDLADVHESAHKINGFARAALNSCLDVVTWLAPDEDVTITAAEGIRECLGLLATSLTFRGYALRNDAGAVEGTVRRSAIRNVLTAALINATDENPAPAEIVLAIQPHAEALVLSLTLRPTEGEPGFTPEAAYRPIEWSDVEALAAAESVSVSREGRQRVLISIPLAE